MPSWNTLLKLQRFSGLENIFLPFSCRLGKFSAFNPSAIKARGTILYGGFNAFRNSTFGFTGPKNTAQSLAQSFFINLFAFLNLCPRASLPCLFKTRRFFAQCLFQRNNLGRLRRA